MRTLLIGGIAASLLATSIAAVAATQEDSTPRQDRLAQALNLTEEQQSQMQALWSKRHEARRQQSEERQGPMSELKALDPNSDTFQADVDKMIEDAQARAAERIRDMAEMQQEMAKILTPEQLAQMQSMQEARGDRHGQGAYRGDRHGSKRQEGDRCN